WPGTRASRWQCISKRDMRWACQEASAKQPELQSIILGAAKFFLFIPAAKFAMEFPHSKSTARGNNSKLILAKAIIMGFILSEALRTELSWASANTSTNEKTIVADYLSHRFHRPYRLRHCFAAAADLRQKFRRQWFHD